MTRYGLPREPESAEFGYKTGAELKTFVFHPRLDIGFEEVVEFARLRQHWNDQISQDAKGLTAALKALTEQRNARVDESGAEVADMSDDEFSSRAQAIEEEYMRKQRGRLDAKIELVLYLVDEHDREAFRPILAKAHPDDISQLLEGLRKQVITRTAKNVEAVMGVDPSLPALPSA
jgi:hypothetical protein